MQKTFSQQGKIIMNNSLIGFDDPAYNIPPVPIKLHFYKGYVIEEYKGLNFLDDTNKRKSSYLSNEMPVFINRKTNQYYRFNSFSDTAAVIYQFTDTDTVRIGVPYEFDKLKSKTPMIDGTLPELEDTLIDGKVIKRHLYSTDREIPGSKYHLSTTMYSRCDLKKIPFHVYEELDKFTGCVCFLTKSKAMTQRIDYSSGKLSKAEKAVFRNMIRKAKKYPGNPPDKNQGLDWHLRSLPKGSKN
jgi:hypothetical protein